MLHPWGGAAHVKLQVHKSAATLINEEAGHLLLLTSLKTDGFHRAIDQAVRTDCRAAVSKDSREAHSAYVGPERVFKYSVEKLNGFPRLGDAWQCSNQSLGSACRRAV